MSTIIDSYGEEHCNDWGWASPNATTFNVGQSFKNQEGEVNISYVKFFNSKTGSPTGNCYAKIYAHSGTFGSSSLPTGEALATSSAVDVSTFSSEPALFTFPFDDCVLSAGDYVVVFTFSSTSSSTNYVWVFIDTTESDPAGDVSHSGNSSHKINNAESSNDWSYEITNDTIFYVYGEPLGPTVGTKYPLPAFKNIT